MSAAVSTGRSWARTARVTVACLVASSLVAGCGIGGFSGLYNAPLPGGADLGDDPYRVQAEFADVLDLVPQAAVKVNDVPVGRIERVGLSDDNSTALVTMLVNGNVRMPETASAKLRQSSLLGEKFVELAAPAPEQPQPAASPGTDAMLTDGSRIP
ncbi:MlaD family protein [Allosaccharopolyspora coralli]|uniref:MlaD family protein n=1 Tax=Allosaccharopolyspora coralli TaxID=2665642 RepID=UPI002B40EB76|nr:MlaD family protein [Allosaccharopolyspora coralli]